MLKRYIAHFNNKEEMLEFTKTHKDIVKVLKIHRQISYPYPDNGVQYQTIYSLYYEADGEQLIKEK